MLSLQVADHVLYKSQDHGGVVILDTDAGECLALNQTAGDLWRTWESSAEFDKGVASLADQYPEVPRESIRADARQLLDELIVRGIIDADLAAARGAAAIMANPDPDGSWPRPGWFRVIIALATLALAAVLVRGPFRVPFKLVRSSRRYWCCRVTTPRHATATVAAVSRAAQWYPGRAACLEQSLAAVLLAAGSRRRLDWCLGTVPDPYQCHAWVAIEGKPVRVPGEPLSLSGRYDPILEI